MATTENLTPALERFTRICVEGGRVDDANEGVRVFAQLRFARRSRHPLEAREPPATGYGSSRGDHAVEGDVVG